MFFKFFSCCRSWKKSPFYQLFILFRHNNSIALFYDAQILYFSETNPDSRFKENIPVLSMELKFQSSFLALALTCFLGLCPEISFGQEGELGLHDYNFSESRNASTANESSEEEELSLHEERSSFKTQSNAFIARDSVFIKSPSNKSTKTKNNNDAQKALTDQRPMEKTEEEEKEDSILSFNFLYYIFEKFKLSDIVDK